MVSQLPDGAFVPLVSVTEAKRAWLCSSSSLEEPLELSDSSLEELELSMFCALLAAWVSSFQTPTEGWYRAYSSVELRCSTSPVLGMPANTNILPSLSFAFASSSTVKRVLSPIMILATSGTAFPTCCSNTWFIGRIISACGNTWSRGASGTKRPSWTSANMPTSFRMGWLNASLV